MRGAVDRMLSKVRIEGMAVEVGPVAGSEVFRMGA